MSRDNRHIAEQLDDNVRWLDTDHTGALLEERRKGLADILFAGNSCLRFAREKNRRVVGESADDEVEVVRLVSFNEALNRRERTIATSITLSRRTRHDHQSEEQPGYDGVVRRAERAVQFSHAAPTPRSLEPLIGHWSDRCHAGILHRWHAAFCDNVRRANRF